MPPEAASSHLAAQARRVYGEHVAAGLPALAASLVEAALLLQEKPAEHATAQRRRDLFSSLHRHGKDWAAALQANLRQALLFGVPSSAGRGDLPPPFAVHAAAAASLQLVDDETIEREIVTSRLSLAIMDRASWEFSDLRSRIASLEHCEELDAQDVLRAHVLARLAVQGWRNAELKLDGWRELQAPLHEEFSHLVEAAYHETNRWLLQQGVLAEIDLRPFIVRTPNALCEGASPVASQAGAAFYTHAPAAHERAVAASAVGAAARRRTGAFDETRPLTRPAEFAGAAVEHAEAVLARLNHLVARHVPQFANPTRPGELPHSARPVSPALEQAINLVQRSLHSRLTAAEPAAVDAPEAAVSPAGLLQELSARKQQLKQAAHTQDERAVIEIVALLFQSILTEDRIPASLRVWFARLQMPVLRVAIGEPDFFSSTDHPARRLIDRMGACVMGFDSGTRAVDEALEREIKRVVQVIEAYPETGRRVFGTVLAEFEKFLEAYFSQHNEATRQGVSLSQQVEQRETLAIQYTIELRRMLNEVPVQDGVRQFLFQVWADVLATTAVSYGVHSPQIKTMKKVAGDLIWSASAKVSREERNEVIRKLPPLLKLLREGMAAAGHDAVKQEHHIQSLNNALAAAFTAKAPVIPHERLQELAERLETLEELLPDASLAIDDAIVFELSGRDTGELEVVGEGGSTPSPAMVAWARELQVGSWFMLDHKARTEPVQLAWQGMRRHLSMFVTQSGHCLLFQQQRLAAYLQAGLLLPAQEEALTVRATRNVLAKLDRDPSRLMG